MKMEDETIDDDGNAQLSSVVNRKLEDILRERGWQNEGKYEIEKATEKGENYIGVVYRIKANIKHSMGNKEKFSCFVKVPPLNPSRRKQFFARPCFLREALAYDKFLPFVADFQTKKGITNYDHRFHEHAKSYGTLTDDFHEAIFMEDLTVRGFQLFDRFKEMDKEHISQVILAYAKLHAASFALQKQEPDKFYEFKVIVDIFEQRKDDEQLGGYFEHLKDVALKSLNFERDRNYWNILKSFFEKETFFKTLLSCINPIHSEPYNVVCHGDCWNNNILFKYEKGNLVDVCLIDWQIMRYSSPVLDLMYFLFCSTTREFRTKYYFEILDVYYNELSEHLLRLGSNVKDLYPRKIFEGQLKEKGVAGLLFAMIVLPIMTLKSEESPNLDELSERIEHGETTDLKGAGFLSSSNVNTYESRMRDVIIDMIDYGYIPHF